MSFGQDEQGRKSSTGFRFRPTAEDATRNPSVAHHIHTPWEDPEWMEKIIREKFGHIRRLGLKQSQVHMRAHSGPKGLLAHNYSHLLDCFSPAQLYGLEKCFLM